MSFNNDAEDFNRFSPKGQLKVSEAVLLDKENERLRALNEEVNNRAITKKIRYFKARLCVNTPIRNRVFYKKCSSVFCGKPLNTIVFNNGSEKPLPIIAYCKSSYCVNTDCIDYRLTMYRLYYESYMINEGQRLNKKSLWLHCVLGFPLVSKDEINKELLSSHRVSINRFMKKAKRLYPYFKSIGVRDISYNKKEDMFYIHYHLALRLFVNWRNSLNNLNRIAKEEGFKFNRMNNKKNDLGLRSAASLINYFAKRKAGLFGDSDKHNTWKYDEFFSCEEYYIKFNKTNTTLKAGWSKKELKWIKYNFNKSYEVLKERTPKGVHSLELRYVLRRKVCDCGCRMWEFRAWDSGLFGDPPGVEGY